MPVSISAIFAPLPVVTSCACAIRILRNHQAPSWTLSGGRGCCSAEAGATGSVPSRHATTTADIRRPPRFPAQRLTFVLVRSLEGRLRRRLVGQLRGLRRRAGLLRHRGGL